MHRFLTRVLPDLLLVVIAGCQAADRALPDGGSQDNALAALERETGQPWVVRYHPDLKTPAFLEGRTAPLAVTPQDAERAGRAFLRRRMQLHGLNSSTAPIDNKSSDEKGGRLEYVVILMDLNMPVLNMPVR